MRSLKEPRRESVAGAEADPVPDDLSRKIMSQARAQQEEVQSEELAERRAAPRVDDDDDDDDGYDEIDDENGWEDDVEELDAADEALLQRLMPADVASRRTLAEYITEKLEEHKAASSAVEVATVPPSTPVLADKVKDTYAAIGELLGRYRSGKLPKAFKIVPRLNNWEDILFLTQPQHWSPQACAAATRLFASSLNPRMAQRFYALILLPAALDDIEANKKLNYHYYMALKKATYKPAAFFKGIVLPMCEQRCSLQQAAIVCSVLAKVSLPAVHCAVTLVKLTEMPLSGASVLFMRTLLMKKYALPYQVLDAVADHFVGFADVDHDMPVLWHQSVLLLAQHYKTELTRDQKERFKVLLRKKAHPQITPEIRRELFTSVSRGEPLVPEVEMEMVPDS